MYLKIISLPILHTESSCEETSLRLQSNIERLEAFEKTALSLCGQFFWQCEPVFTSDFGKQVFSSCRDDIQLSSKDGLSCFEFVLYAAYRSGDLSKEQLRNILTPKEEDFFKQNYEFFHKMGLNFEATRVLYMAGVSIK